MNSVLKMMNFAFKMLKMMNRASKMMNFAFKTLKLMNYQIENDEFCI